MAWLVSPGSAGALAIITSRRHFTGAARFSKPRDDPIRASAGRRRRGFPYRSHMSSLINDYSLLAHNTFGFDVRTRFARTIEDEGELADALHDARTASMPRLVLGGGSNIVLTRDFPGVVWLVGLGRRRIVRETADAWFGEAAAGENWHDFVAWFLDAGCRALENLALIPGTTGAAPIQNIGAYGLEIAEYFDSLRAFDLSTGEIVELDCADCAFGYRDSVFKRLARDRYLILSVRFKLPKAWRPRAAYADIARELAARGIVEPSARDIFTTVSAVRRAKLPDPTA